MAFCTPREGLIAGSLERLTPHISNNNQVCSISKYTPLIFSQSGVSTGPLLCSLMLYLLGKHRPHHKVLSDAPGALSFRCRPFK